LVPLGSAWLLNKIKAKSEVSTGQFAMMFLHGNPFMAFNSMIRFQRAKDERTTVSVTERLGQARSPFTVEELLEALADPRFNVRFEAIISIARTDPDPRLTQALCTMLERGEPALSVVAAWALGRIGDQMAVDALRDALEAPYRSIQAHSARSLGTLQDDEIKEVLLRRLAQEHDEGLKIAFTAALSKLGAVEAIPDMLALLKDTDDHYLRMEIALALGSLVGEEGAFVRLLRGIRQDIGMTASQALIEISRKLGPDLPLDLHDMFASSIEAFSRDDLKSGINSLAEAALSLDSGTFPPEVGQVLTVSASALQTGGIERDDFLVLLLHTLSHHLSTA
jgi:HEAT repeat protein